MSSLRRLELLAGFFKASRRTNHVYNKRGFKKWENWLAGNVMEWDWIEQKLWILSALFSTMRFLNNARYVLISVQRNQRWYMKGYKNVHLYQRYSVDKIVQCQGLHGNEFSHTAHYRNIEHWEALNVKSGNSYIFVTLNAKQSVGYTHYVNMTFLR